MGDISIVYDTGYDISRDGYTKVEKAFHANGLWAIRLRCDHYQSLIDRNWRRSGKYLYKPHPDKCLSLQYTIRLDVHKFVPSQSHKNLIKRIRAYLQDGVMPPATNEKDENKKHKSHHKDLELQKSFAKQILHILKSNLNIDIIDSESEVHVMLPTPQKSTGKHKKQKVGDLFCGIGMQLFGKLKKTNKTSDYSSPGALAEQIVDYLKKEQQVMQYCASIEASNNGFINFFLNDNGKEQLKNSLKLKDSTNDQSSENTSSSNSERFIGIRAQPAHNLSISMRPAGFDPEAYQLYRKYQIAVHKESPDEITEKSYTDFLVNSPMSIEKTGLECKSFPMEDEIPGLEGLSSMIFTGFGGYGSYHVHYRLDGKLFMVGVIDLLPNCLSSVYLYYDPDMMFLKPGVYSALAEILYVKLLSKRLPNLHYYYMGYYIYTCKKMRYKAGYKPSELLCPVTYKFVPIDQCMEAVKRDNDHEKVKPEQRKLRLAPDDVPAEVVDVSNLNDILCIVDRNLVTFGFICQNFHVPNSEIENLKTFKRLVGPSVCSQMARILDLDSLALS